MDKKENITTSEVQKSTWKKWVAKFGIGGLIFFTIKGIISTSLIYFLGKNFLEVIASWFQ